MLRALLTAACVLPAHAFLEDILRQMHGGQGGGQQQQFHMGGGQVSFRCAYDLRVSLRAYSYLSPSRLPQ